MNGAAPSAHDRVMLFTARHGGAALLLACHGAAMHTMRPEALALIRGNFLTGAARLDPALDAALLFSELCHDRGGGFYEFDPDVKHHLVRMLDAVQPRSASGRYRSQDVARFLREYARHLARTELRARTPRFRRYLDELTWRALALDDADAAAREIFAHLDRRQNHAPDSSTPVPLGAGLESVAGPVLGTLNRELVFARALDMIRDPGHEDDALRLMETFGQTPLSFGGGPVIRPAAMLSEQRAFRRRRAHARNRGRTGTAALANSGEGGTADTLELDADTVELHETTLHHLTREGDLEGLCAALDAAPERIDTLGDGGLSPLHIAVQRHHDDIVAELLLRGADLDRETPLKVTPFFMACEYGAVAAGVRLLEAGADPFAATAGNATPLMAALFYGTDPLAQAIMDHPRRTVAHLRQADDRGQTALMWTVARGSAMWFDRLLAAGAEISAPEPGRFSMLHHAAWGGNMAIAARLIAAGHPVDPADSGGWTPLTTCAQTGAAEVAALLIDCGADTDRPQAFGWPPLLIAASWDKRDVFSTLHRAGADMRRANKAGLCAVHVAAHHGAIAVLEYLLGLPKTEVDIAATTPAGQSALDLALLADRADALCLLATSGRFGDAALSRVIGKAIGDEKFAALERLIGVLPTLPEQTDRADPWAWALLKKKQDSAQAPLTALLARIGGAVPAVAGVPFLVELAGHDMPFALDHVLAADGDVDITGPGRKTALRKAVEKGHDAMVARLLTAGADPGHTGARREDPMLFTARGAVLRLLLARGADPQARGVTGLTALHALVAGRDVDSAAQTADNDHGDFAALRAAGLSPEAEDNHGARPLHLAAARGNTGWMDLLLREGSAVEVRRRDGATPLHLAAAMGHADAVALLLKAGAAGLSCRDDGCNAAYLATRGGHSETLALLMERGHVRDAASAPRTLVQLAAELNAVDALRLLLDQGHDGDVAPLGSAAPLIRAVQAGSYSAAKMLVDHGADTEIHDPRTGLTLGEIAGGRLRLHRANRVDTGHPRSVPTQNADAPIRSKDAGALLPPFPDQDVLERLSGAAPMPPAPAAPDTPPPRRTQPDKGDIPHTGVFLAGMAADGADDAAGWSMADSLLRQTAVGQVAGMEARYRMTAVPQVLVRPLPFFRDVRLVRLRSPDWDRRRLALFFLEVNGQLHWLNGTSPVIHEINQRHGVELTADTVLSYLRFFCFFVRGEGGPFYVAETLADPVLSGFTGRTAEILKGVLRTATVDESVNDGFICSAVIFYSSAIFISRMKVGQGGMIEMLKDEPVAADLPTRIDAPVS